jgi:hypothetical protein
VHAQPTRSMLLTHIASARPSAFACFRLVTNLGSLFRAASSEVIRRILSCALTRSDPVVGGSGHRGGRFENLFFSLLLNLDVLRGFRRRKDGVICGHRVLSCSLEDLTRVHEPLRLAQSSEVVVEIVPVK